LLPQNGSHPQFLSKKAKQTKIGYPIGHPIFVVRSTGIESVSKLLKAFIYKEFNRLVAKNTPIFFDIIYFHSVNNF
jgi:hypothetical protein